MRRFTPQFAALAALILAQSLITAQGPAPAAPPAPSGPLTFNTESGQRIRVSEVAGGLVHPHSIAFPDADTILVTEKPGRLRVIKKGTLLPTPAWVAPRAARRQAGTDRLTRLAALPRAASAIRHNRLVYLSYQKYGPRGSTIGVSRGTLKGDTLVDVNEIFVAEAWDTSGANPGRMLFRVTARCS